MLAIFRRFLLCAMCVALCACTATKPKEPLRIGFNPWPGYEFLYLAKAKGFYEKAGLEVKLVELNTLGDVRRAFERGQIDVMGSTLVEAAVAAEVSGKKIKIIAVVDSSHGADVLIARRPVASVAELKGKKVGAEGITVDVLNTYFALKSANLQLKDIELVLRSQDELVRELQAGRIDAMQTYPPYSIALLKDPQYQQVFDTSKVPGQVIDVLSVNADVLAQRPADIKALVLSFFAAMDDFQRNQQADAQLMGARTGGDAESYLAGLNGLQLISLREQRQYFAPNGRALASLSATGAALQATGILKAPVHSEAFFSEQTMAFYP